MSAGLKSAFGWSAVQSVARIVLGFLSVKVTAVYLGPAGIALTSQVNNVISLLQSLVGNAVDDGVVKLTAQHADSPPEVRRRIVSTAFRWILAVSAVLGIGLIVLSPWIAEALLGDRAWAPIIGLMALVLPVCLLGQLLVSVFTGLRRFELVTFTQIAANVLSFGMLAALCILWGLTGGMIGTVVAYVLVFAAAAALTVKARTLALGDFSAGWDREHARTIWAFYPMLLARAAALPSSLLFVRSVMLDDFGAAQSGLWQGAVRLSDMYTMVIATALNMYSLPTLSASKSDDDLRRNVVGLAWRTAAIVGSLALVLYLLRHLIVRLVFTKGFEPVGDLWRGLLISDVFLLACVPLRQALMVRQRVVAYITAEVVVALIFVLASLALMSRFGPEGASLARALAWGLVFALLVWLNRQLLWPSRRPGER